MCLLVTLFGLSGKQLCSREMPEKLYVPNETQAGLPFPSGSGETGRPGREEEEAAAAAGGRAVPSLHLSSTTGA